MNKQKIQLKCKACGGVFEAFLDEMAQHNGRVTCPGCHEKREYVDTDVQKVSSGN